MILAYQEEEKKGEFFFESRVQTNDANFQVVGRPAKEDLGLRSCFLGRHGFFPGCECRGRRMERSEERDRDDGPSRNLNRLPSMHHHHRPKMIILSE
jgi:hypothetical protein